MNERVKCAAIGCGRFGRIHLKRVVETGRFDLVGVADLDEEAARSAASDFGVPRWETDYGKLLEDPEIEAVLVYTPALAHAQPTIDALRAGKHVYCEKPMARTTAHARKMAQAARESGLVLQIGYVMRHSPDAVHLRRLIVEGRIGRPVFYRDIWALAKGNPSPGTHDFEIGGGVLYEQGHWLDFVSFVFGRATKVYASTHRFKPDGTTADDTIILIVDFESGDQAIWSNSWAAKGMGWDVKTVGRKGRSTLDIIGPKGSIHFPNRDGEFVLSLYESDDQDGAPTESWEWETDWGANASGYVGELIHFARCVREGLAPVPSGDEALQANVLFEAVMESSQTGEAVHLGKES